MTTPDAPHPESTKPPVNPTSTPAPETVVLAPLPAVTPDTRTASTLPDHPPGEARFLLTGLVLLFAFLAASFPASNSDLWMHLAGGRLLAEGRYAFGRDPFALPGADVPWANHAWLSDLILYLGYTHLGGPALIVLKALLVGVLALVLLRVRRSDSSLLLPAVCTLLALLTLGPRALLQPACVSLLFVGLTLGWLWRARTLPPEKEPLSPAQGLRRHAPLLLLFVLWCNLDGWYLLGTLLVALFWLGDRWEARRSKTASPGAESAPCAFTATPGWLVLAGLAACLLNVAFLSRPSLAAFAVPDELAPLLTGSVPRHDPRFQQRFESPWQAGIPWRTPEQISLAACAYFVLVGLGLVSFLLRPAQGRRGLGWRLLVWVVFAALGAWQVREAPLFAVVAGPITALNFQDFLHTRRRLRGGAAVVALAALVLCALAWPGWLQGFTSRHRRVAWKVQADPSLQRVAETLRDWHRQGRLRETDRVLALHPAVGDYCAWFCPEIKGVLDHRFQMTPTQAQEYENFCRRLIPSLAPGETSGASLPEREYACLVVYDPQLANVFTAMARLMSGYRTVWKLAAIDGQAVLFGRQNDTRAEGFNPDRLAFAAQAAAALPAAPGHGPQRGPQATTLASAFVRPLPAPTWESPAASLYLRYAEDAGTRRKSDPALSLLAIRAARAALAVNPDDTNAYLRLGQAYLDLLSTDAPEERVVPLVYLRHVQIVTALESVLVLQPNQEAAHRQLFLLYLLQRSYDDLALDHGKALLEIIRRARPNDASLATLQSQVELLEKRVLKQRNLFSIRSKTLGDDPLERALLARSMGLSGMALNDILLRSQVVLFGTAGAKLEIELLLMTGQAWRARELLHEDAVRTHRSKLGFADLELPDRTGRVRTFSLPAYAWLDFLQAAATGDYDAAQGTLEGSRKSLRHEVGSVFNALGMNDAQRIPLPVKALATDVCLAAQPQGAFLRASVLKPQQQVYSMLDTAFFLKRETADLSVLSGLLELERGRPEEAGQHFHQALAGMTSATGAPLDFAGRPLAEAYRTRLRGQ